MDINEIHEQVNSVNQASDVLVQFGQQSGGEGEGKEKEDSHQQVPHLP